ncbi:hypothetical protein TVAGG3_0542650 [Trichomonas vaginalis G3]|uniref:hypothetical protein n=1 Tax=Trichomonas vaginalis (strain ATCC PRA-98 / G3) TaxID=412133 RepID=UPI0021E530AD|nr:hypothetical protein TVAGG3_0542650 [Trichomonas vaginalis G3]KAI5519948.1 hypothetical protein TVAGG3_0542650 [Trichomonas vaginalis G3]
MSTYTNQSHSPNPRNLKHQSITQSSKYSRFIPFPLPRLLPTPKAIRELPPTAYALLPNPWMFTSSPPAIQSQSSIQERRTEFEEGLKRLRKELMPTAL